ncbi:hypothetical protein ACE10Z_13160 [Bradyrhizobium sp. Pha-3]|uniref:hypothetical protein n=1 Tax=Bradyrhizobium sp. Pha-3 TaxID=208375 RepID=UPI0035D4E730
MVDIASGDSQWIASYDRAIAFSPDLKSVASSGPLELKPQAPQLRVVLVKDKRTIGQTQRPEWIKWSANGSRIAVVYPTSVDILDRNGVNIASMTKSDIGWVKNGWFEDDQRTLTLFIESGQPPGSILKCNVAGKRCLARPRIESLRCSKTDAAIRTELRLRTEDTSRHAQGDIPWLRKHGHREDDERLRTFTHTWMS